MVWKSSLTLLTLHPTVQNTIISLNLPDECVSTKLRVAVNHVCFYLVTQFYYNYYYFFNLCSVYVVNIYLFRF